MKGRKPSPPVEAPASSEQEMREKIVALENEMRKLPQIEIETKHHFAPGVYMREVFIPKGSLVTGKIHKTEHLSILSQGEMSVLTEGGMKRLTASTVVKSFPGIKRAVFAHEDSVWITVHPNTDNETEIEKLEDRLVVQTFGEFEAFMGEAKRLLEGS